MLVLTRKPGECIHIGDDVHVTVVAIQGQKTRLGFDAPKSVNIMRSELIWREGILHDETTTDPANS
jgi:carbon storage regulator